MSNHSGNRSNSAQGCNKAIPLRVPATATALALVMALSQTAHASAKPQSPQDLNSASKRESNSKNAFPQQTLTEVVVSARRQAIISADRIEKHSDTIVDVVVANKAGLLPDNSVTEVLQRVSGVTMSRFAALNDPDHLSDQGTSVQIRGLSDVAARLNGQDIFSAGSGGGLSFSAIPPELLKAVEVYKDETSNLIEGGSGGQVDLITHMPFDYSPGLHVSGTVSGNWGDLSKQAEPAVSALATDNWRGPWGRFGALVDLAYSKLSFADNFIRNEPYYKTLIGNQNYYIPGGYDYGFDKYQRTRKGAYLGLQWAPNSHLKIGEMVFYSKYQSTGSGDGVFVTSKALAVNPSNSTFDSNGALISSSDVFTRNSSTFSATGAPNMYATGDAGVHQNHNETLDASTTVDWNPTSRLHVTGGYQLVSASAGSKSYDIFDTPPSGTGGYGLVETSGQPNITLSPAMASLYANPASYYWYAHQDHRGHHDGQEQAFDVNGEYRMSEHGFFRSVETGARYSDRREQDADTIYNWAPFCEGWNGCAKVPLSQADVSNGMAAYQPFSGFFRGSVTLPAPVYLPSQALVSQYNPAGNVATLGGSVANGATNLDGSPYVPYQFNPGDYSLATSYDTAAYVMLKFADYRMRFPISGNLGLRYVKIENRSSGYFLQSAVTLPGALNSAGVSTGSTALFPSKYYFRSGGSTTRRVLPAINVKLTLARNLFARGAFFETLDEPSFYDLRASGSAGASVSAASASSGGQVTGYTSNTGNPALRPMQSNNWDFALQWFPQAASEAHLDFFYKTLKNTIVYGNTLQPVPFVTANGTTVIENASVNVDFNSPKAATIKGVEFGGHTYFSMLPWPWNGLGIESNFTYIDSSSPGNQYVDISGVIHHNVPVVGLSKYNYNAVLMYDDARWSARLAWSWRSRYLMTTDSNGTNGSYTYYSAPGVGQTIGISLPVYAAAYGELDLGLTYRPTKNLSIAAQIGNLTNSTTKTLMGGYPNNALYVRSWFTSDRRISLAVHFKF